MKKSFQLMFYGFKARTNLTVCGIFLVIGLLFEVGMNLEMAVDPSDVVWQPLGGVFLGCMPLFGVQMLCSITSSSLVNTSPASRRLKTDWCILSAGIISLVLFLVQVALKIVISLICPGASMAIWMELLFYAAISTLLFIFSAFLFRFFLATFLVLYLAMFSIGTITGYMTAGIGEEFTFASYLPQFDTPVLYVLVSALILAAGLAIFYGLSLILYKIPFSKFAFGAGLNKTK